MNADCLTGLKLVALAISALALVISALALAISAPALAISALALAISAPTLLIILKILLGIYWSFVLLLCFSFETNMAATLRAFRVEYYM